MNEKTQHRRYTRLVALIGQRRPHWLMHYVAFQAMRKLRVGRGQWTIAYTIEARPHFTASVTIWAPFGRAARQAAKNLPERIRRIERSARRAGYHGEWHSSKPTVLIAHLWKRVKNEKAVAVELKRLETLDAE